jgi:hypothetical protein
LKLEKIVEPMTAAIIRRSPIFRALMSSRCPCLWFHGSKAFKGLWSSVISYTCTALMQIQLM